MISDIVWYEFSNYSISPLNFIIHHSFGTWELKLKFFKGFLCSFKIVVESNILLSFFLNMIILKCSPFFKRSKDKKNQKTLGRQSDNFCLPILHVLCYWLLWTVLSTLFYAHLPSKHLISRQKILKLCTFSQHGDIQLSPPHKIHWSQDDCIKEKRDLLHWLILTPFNCFILT